MLLEAIMTKRTDVCLHLLEGNQQNEVGVERLEGGQFRIALPDAARTFRVHSNGDSTHSLIDESGRQFCFSLLQTVKSGERKLTIGGEHGIFHLGILDPLEYRMRESAGKARNQRGWKVTSSLPGKIKKILVNDGEEITAGTPLIVMEAMKMENEVCAEEDGIIKKITCREGQIVETGVILITADPAGG